MHPSVHAQATPDKPALIVAETGETWSYAELDRRSNRVAQLFRARGLRDRRYRRLFPRQRARFLRADLGRATRRAVLRLHLVEADRARGAIYRRGFGAKLVVASAALGHVAERLGPMIGDRGKLVLGGAVIGLAEPRGCARRTARHADRRRARRDRHALFVGHHRAAQGRARRACPRIPIPPQPTC